MVNALDKMKAFEAFEALILPQLQADMAAGLTADQIYKKYEHLAAARAVSIVMTEKDNSKALNAAKDILDRAQGKAVEKKEVKHTLDKLPDEQLDALLLTELEDMGPGLPPAGRETTPAPKKKRGRPTKSQRILDQMKKEGIYKGK